MGYTDKLAFGLHLVVVIRFITVTQNIRYIAIGAISSNFLQVQYASRILVRRLFTHGVVFQFSFLVVRRPLSAATLRFSIFATPLTGRCYASRC